MSEINDNYVGFEHLDDNGEERDVDSNDGFEDGRLKEKKQREGGKENKRN